MELLELIAAKAGYCLISDMCPDYMNEYQKGILHKRVKKIIRSIPVEDYSAAEWREALSYLGMEEETVRMKTA